MKFMKTKRPAIIMLAVIAVALLAGAYMFISGSRFMEWQAKRTLGEPSYLDGLEDGLHVLLLGTGSPMADIQRAGVSTVIIAGSHTYIVDAGDGSMSRARTAKLTLGNIEAMFITHFHSDHIAGAGEFMLNRWVDGNHKEPLDVYGPMGVEKVVEGFNTAYSQDAGYRTAHHGTDFAPPAGAGGKAMAFDLGEDAIASKVILEEDGVTVTAFNVDHSPVKPAVGYKFEYKGRSAVISGDTVYSESLLSQSRQVDLLVHEALSVELTNLIQKYGNKTASKVAQDIVSYHASPEDVADIAEKAGVQHLAYSHIIPPINSLYLENYFTKNAKKIYRGDMILGNDGMIFSMPADSDEFSRKDLIK